MAYYFYLDKILLPIAPPKLELQVNNKNKTMDLIGHGEVNILKKSGLTDIKFDARIPHHKYPFATYKDGFKSAKFFIDEIEKLKANNKPFQFIVSRFSNTGAVLFHTNIKVSLEEYSLVEDAEDGSDITISIKLKQYRDYVCKKIVMSKPGQGSISSNRPPGNNHPNGKTYRVKKGDSLWSICKSQLGDGSLYKKVYNLNKNMIDSRNKGYNVFKYTIYPNQVLILE